MFIRADQFDADDPPLLIVHGTLDTAVSYAQGLDPCDRYRAAGNTVDFYSFKGGHGAWSPVSDGRTLPEIGFDFATIAGGSRPSLTATS